MNTEQQQASSQYLSIKQLAEEEPAFSQAALRALIFAAKARRTSQGMIEGNGLESALIHVGRRVLIHRGRFYAWLEGHSANRFASLQPSRKSPKQRAPHDAVGPPQSDARA